MRQILSHFTEMKMRFWRLSNLPVSPSYHVTENSPKSLQSCVFISNLYCFRGVSLSSWWEGIQASIVELGNLQSRFLSQDPFILWFLVQVEKRTMVILSRSYTTVCCDLYLITFTYATESIRVPGSTVRTKFECF